MDFVQYILTETSWLYTKIYQNNFLFFDLWSIVHFWSGFVILLLLQAFRLKPALLLLFIILFIYELAEILFLYFAFDLFRPETLKDQVTDMLVGLAGGLLSAWLLNYAMKQFHSRRYLVLSGMMMLAASTYAFPWVGFYHYHYDIEAYNTGGGMNFYTYLTWTVAGFILLQVFYFLKKQRFILRVLTTWSGYFIALLLFESITYHLMGIHENSLEGASPLIFGLIHGTRVMHVFYMICPFLIMMLYGIGVWLLKRIHSLSMKMDNGLIESSFLSQTSFKNPKSAIRNQQS
jgi:hypothetical protein